MDDNTPKHPNLSLDKMRERMAHARKTKTPKSPDKTTRPVSVSLSPLELEKLRKLGNGNATKGIRYLLAAIDLDRD